MPFLESAAFASVLTQASSWVQQASGRAADNEAKRAAQLLYSAGVVVAALRTLDNAFRRVVGAVSQLDVSWPAERRQAVVDSILDIAHSDVVLPELQDAVGYLHRTVPQLAEPERAQSQRILDGGNDVVGFLAKAPDHTPFETKEQLTTLLNGIRQADTPAWADRTVELCEEALWIFDRRGLGELTVSLGQLKATLVEKHPSIAPAPRWTLAAATAPLTSE